MKKTILIMNFIIFVSCNLSDRTIELPKDYSFEREGGYSNIVTRNHKFIIDHGALDYSYDEKYLMFVYDTIKIIPEKISTTKLFFRVVDIKKDSISRRMNYTEYKKFIIKKKVDKRLDLSLKNFRNSPQLTIIHYLKVPDGSDLPDHSI